MNSRRSFFSKLAAIASVVVLAPEIAFRAKLPLPEPVIFPSNALGIYAQLQQCGSLADCEVKTLSSLELEKLFSTVHDLNQKRPKTDRLEIWASKESADSLYDYIMKHA